MSSNTYPISYWRSAPILLGALVVYAFFARQLAPFVPDDAYISFRYAEHLAQGHGLTFNVGEAPLEGYSNFLWILVCAVASRFGELPRLAPALSGVFGGLCVVTLWATFVRRVRSRYAMALPLLLCALSGPIVLYSVSGMETSLFALLLLLLVNAADAAAASERILPWLGLALLGVLLGLARPEGVIAFPVVVLLGALQPSGSSRPGSGARHTSRLVVALATFGVLLLAYHVWRVQYFGEWLPTPFTSKGAGASLYRAWSVNLGFYFERQTHHFAPFGYYYLTLGLLGAAALAAGVRAGGVSALESTSFALAGAYAVVYFNFVDWMPGMRYQAPLVGLLLIPLGRLGSAPSAAEPRRARVLPALSLAIALVLFSAWSMAQLRIDGRSMEDSSRASLVPLGQWLGSSLPAHAVMAMSDVGAAPYFSRLRTIDINPHALTDPHVASHGFDKEYLFGRNPDVVILVSWSLQRLAPYDEYAELVRDPRFVSGYRLIGTTRYDWYGDRSYWVYLRRGLEIDPVRMEAFPGGIGAEPRAARQYGQGARSGARLERVNPRWSEASGRA